MERRDLVVVVTSCYSSLRVEDMHAARFNNFTKQPANQISPRSIVAILDKTKNDKSGTGPIAGRTFVIPCICMPEAAANKRKWCRVLQENPDANCLDGCPYDILGSYLKDCPTVSKASDPPLAFIRALPARGDLERRCLARGLLSYNEIMKIPERVNQMLPENVQTKTWATGKLGRMTFSTLAMNATDVGGEATSMATKHRDPKTLLGYVGSDNALLMRAAQGIGSAMKNSSKDFLLAGVDISDSQNETSKSTTLTINDEDLSNKRPLTTIQNDKMMIQVGNSKDSLKKKETI